MIEKTASTAAAQASSRSERPARPDAAEPLFEVRVLASGRGLFALCPIAPGTRLFGENDWADEAERRSFTTLTPAEFGALSPARRAIFARYAYNTAPDQITGTFRPQAVRHPTNFANHSCDPNAGYDGADAIVALRAIATGEEIRMDYGTFSFSFDHAFACRCGAAKCRGRVRGADWPDLVRAGLRLPGFMRERAALVA